MLYFVVDDLTQAILNVVDWDGETEYSSSYPGATLYEAVEGYDVGHYRQEDGSYGNRSLVVEKINKKRLIDARMADVFKAGYSPSTGPLSGHTLQVRDNDDRTNWLTSQASYMAAVSAGMGSYPGASFRTAANQTITLTFSEGLTVLTNGMAMWGKTIMAHSWSLKDEVAAATSYEELEAIDIETGWPQG